MRNWLRDWITAFKLARLMSLSCQFDVHLLVDEGDALRCWCDKRQEAIEARLPVWTP